MDYLIVNFSSELFDSELFDSELSDPAHQITENIREPQQEWEEGEIRELVLDGVRYNVVRLNFNGVLYNVALVNGVLYVMS